MVDNFLRAHRLVSNETDPDLNPGSPIPESVFLTPVPFRATSNSDILKD